MILTLLAALAMAQEPMEFPPSPVDVEVDGEVLAGILVDEATFEELGRLRVLARTQGQELEAFEVWQDRQLRLTDETIAAIRSESESGLTTMRAYYDGELTRASKRNFGEKHGFPLGVAVGVTVTTILAVGTIAAVSGVYEVSVVR